MKHILRIACVLFVAGLAGCSAGPVKHPVSGSVTWEGVPVEQGYIKFVPADGAGIEEAIPIAKGAYNGQISPGSKKVEILATREKTVLTAEDKEAQKTMGMAPRESFIPEEYNVKTVLTATISAGVNTIDFALPQTR